jgi:hypothetical protein
MTFKLEWEISTDDSIHRAPVVGGWLIKIDTFNQRSVFHGRDNESMNSDPTYDSKLLFIPDDGHKWDLEKFMKGE